MHVIGLLLLIIPIAMALWLFAKPGNARQQTAVVALAALVTLGIVLSYSIILSLGPGDTWIGVAIVCLAPYVAVLGALRLRLLSTHPALLLVVVPIAFFFSLIIVVVLAVNVGLIGPP
ncbi:MAG: hypothetical protein WBG93_04305 [Thermoanaerobaculia bacterium]